MDITENTQAPLPMSALESSRELSMSPPLVPDTCTSPQPMAQNPGSGADPAEAHETTPNGFDPQVFTAYRWNNAGKVEPSTIPTLAGELPRTGHNKVHEISDKMPNNAITATYLHYGLRIPPCEGLSESDARSFKVRELKAYHRPWLNHEANDIEEVEFQRHNINELQMNCSHQTREAPFLVPTLLHPIGFDIPNTIPGLEQLSVEQKRELLTACYYPWTENDLDFRLMTNILIAFNLRHHFLEWNIIDS